MGLDGERCRKIQKDRERYGKIRKDWKRLEKVVIDSGLIGEYGFSLVANAHVLLNCRFPYLECNNVKDYVVSLHLCVKKL